MIGRKFGRYEIIGPLGQGGLASVWKAKDDLLGRVVALKILDEKWAQFGDVVRRFLHEAESTAALTHPGIVAAFDTGDVDGRPYLVLSCIDGEVLSDRARRSLMPIAEAIRIVAAVADALAYAHDHRIIHRDVTGRNIMISREGRVYLLDFGLALAAWETRLTEVGASMGTAPYMAPEILRGNEADARSDLYGLGIVFYEALTGTHPFSGPSTAVLVQQSLDADPTPPSALRPEIAPALDALVLRAIARDPACRFPTVRAFLAELEGMNAVAAASAAAGLEAPRHGPGEAPMGAAPAGGARPDPLFLSVLPFTRSGMTLAAADACDVLVTRLDGTIRAALASGTGIRVVLPHQTSSATSMPPTEPIAFARSQGANAILVGTVALEGSSLRASYSLIDARNGVHFGGGVLDGSVFDLFQLEDDVVRAIRHSLAIQVTRNLDREPTRPPDAASEDHHLQALASLRRYDSETSVDGAIRLLEQLLAADGRSAHLWGSLGRALLYKFRLSKQRAWEARAADAVDRARTLDPDSLIVHLALGELRSEAGLHDAAVSEYDLVLARSPGHFDALCGLARTRLAMADADAAEAHAREAIAVAPDDWRGHNVLGEALARRGHFAEALAAWRRVVELTPDNAIGWRNIGTCHHGLDQFEAAVEAYRRSLSIQPNALAYSNLATVLYFQKEYEEAAEMFRSATQLRPADPILWGNLGNAYRWIPGHEQESVAGLDRAIALGYERLQQNPADYRLWARLAEWLASRGRNSEARKALELAVDKAPDDMDVIVRAAHIHIDLGERDAGLGWIRRAVERGYPVSEFRRSNELAWLRGDAEFERILGLPEDGAGTPRAG